MRGIAHIRGETTPRPAAGSKRRPTKVMLGLRAGSASCTGRVSGWSDAEACRWYRKAADQGYAWAQRRLGSMYEFGKGVERSIPKACHLYELAASQGDTWAQDALRSMR